MSPWITIRRQSRPRGRGRSTRSRPVAYGDQTNTLVSQVTLRPRLQRFSHGVRLACEASPASLVRLQACARGLAEVMPYFEGLRTVKPGAG